jgi:hypothetical protein
MGRLNELTEMGKPLGNLKRLNTKKFVKHFFFVFNKTVQNTIVIFLFFPVTPLVRFHTNRPTLYWPI